MSIKDFALMRLSIKLALAALLWASAASANMLTMGAGGSGPGPIITPLFSVTNDTTTGNAYGASNCTFGLTCTYVVATGAFPIVIPIPVTLTEVTAYFGGNAGTVISNFFTSSPGATTCTLVASSGPCNQVASEAIAQGTLFQWQQAFATGPGAGRISALFQSATGHTTEWFKAFQPNNSSNVISAVAYLPIDGGAAIQNSDAAASQAMPTGGTLTGMYFFPNGPGGATNYHIAQLEKNGADVSGWTCNDSASTSGCCFNVAGAGKINGGPSCTALAALTYSAGDTFSWKVSCATAGCSTIYPALSLSGISTGGGVPLLAANRTLSATPLYAGVTDNAATATSTNVYYSLIPQPPNSTTFFDFFNCVSTSPGGSNSRVGAVYYGATLASNPTTASGMTTGNITASTACPLTGTGGAGAMASYFGAQDTTHTYAGTANYNLGYEFTSASAATSTYGKAGMMVLIQ